MSDRRTLFADLPTRPSIVRNAEGRNENEEDDAGDDTGKCFSVARGVRQFIPMLELRFASGNARAFEYSMLEEVSFDPSKGISLYFGRVAVVISGQNLAELFDGIVRHSVRWIRELARHQLLETAEAEPVTTSIRVVEKQ